MPPSQLKALKQSIRDEKLSRLSATKKKKSGHPSSTVSSDNHARRHNALQNVRERANPFEYRTAAARKFEVTTNQNATKESSKQPSLTRSQGEDKRRKTLLYERQRLKKLGGIVDRRFGENDQAMTLEEKAIERFMKERERRSRGKAIFDLEDSEENLSLTHLGHSLGEDGIYEASALSLQKSMHPDGHIGHALEQTWPRKRRRLSESDEISENDDAGSNGRPKSKKEAMEEVIAKSRLGRFERQKAKEDDDRLRAELDQGLPALYSMLSGRLQPELPANTPGSSIGQQASINPDRLAMIEGRDRKEADIEYDERVRQMAIDQRAVPAGPTLTEEQKQQRDADRVQDLEDRRLQRMQREELSPDNEEASQGVGPEYQQPSDLEPNETFGLGPGLAHMQGNPQLDVEDEDNFLVEDIFEPIPSSQDSDSGLDNGLTPLEDGSSYDSGGEFSDLSSEGRPERIQSKTSGQWPNASIVRCPSTLAEMLDVTERVEIAEVPAMIQKIRASTQPSLDAGNKVKMSAFAAVLVDYLHVLAKSSNRAAAMVLDKITRHIHSLAKGYSLEVGQAFRGRLKEMMNDRWNSLNDGDLIILSAVGTIFPTSDHFHQVVTPAMLCMTRYLSQTRPDSLCDLAKGTFICTLCIHYQSLSKRLIPEVVNYVFKALRAMASFEESRIDLMEDRHAWPSSFRVLALRDKSVSWDQRSLRFADIATAEEDSEPLRQSLLYGHLGLLDAMAEMWSEQPAFCESFAPFHKLLHNLLGPNNGQRFPPDLSARLKVTAQKLYSLMQNAMRGRIPLRLHHHRPLPIKTSLPKFDESFNPDKHNDPDADRAELAKLQAQHKKERKGALRELRKDSRFLAKEDLREKKEADAAYDKKFKRLVSEIQGEEGHEFNVYAKEKRLRTGKR